MPTKIKIVVSILVLLAALVLSYFEQRAGNTLLKWFVIGLGLFMAVSLWLFPEPRRDTNKDLS